MAIIEPLKKLFFHEPPYFRIYAVKIDPTLKCKKNLHLNKLQVIPLIHDIACRRISHSGLLSKVAFYIHSYHFISLARMYR